MASSWFTRTREPGHNRHVAAANAGRIGSGSSDSGGGGLVQCHAVLIRRHVAAAMPASSMRQNRPGPPGRPADPSNGAQQARTQRLGPSGRGLGLPVARPMPPVVSADTAGEVAVRCPVNVNDHQHCFG